MRAVGNSRQPRRVTLERLEDLAPQLRLHAHRTCRPDEVPQPGREPPSGCRDDEHDEQRPGLRHPDAIDEPRDEGRERPREGDDRRDLQERQCAAHEEEATRRSRAANEPRIEWFHDQCAAASMEARVTRLRNTQYVQPW